MDLTADFKSFQDLVQASLINVTRSATQVSNQDLGFHRSSSDKLSRALDRQNAHLLRLTNKLLKAATQDTPLKPPTLQNQDSVEDDWRGIVDVVDGLLEKADSALDEFSGIIKPQDPARQGADPSPRPTKTGLGFQRSAASNLQKPQTHFHRQVNNSDPTPFKPLLQTKPHAIVPLEQSIGTEDTGYGYPILVLRAFSHSVFRYNHPYAREIEDYKYPPSVYEFNHPIPFSPIGETEHIFVDTEEGVIEMLEELKGAKEIAIDLEHNDLRSYVGLVCLMQISTRKKDWIIDTLKPWREKLQMLNQVFADPKILKVLHGSNMDIIWLQRDLGLYIVGLFDTYHAACALQFQGKGLKHLLLQFANVHAQKQYQLADWRVRPLPQDLIDYARSDTHYLLTIYDHMRNMLVNGSAPNVNLTDYVLMQSKKEALQVYTRQLYDLETGGGPLGWFALLTQRYVNLNKEQLGVFRALHAWRDRRARELDEGIQYILPNRTLWLVAENMPTSAFNFHQTCRGESKLVSDRIPEIIEVVKQGKIEGKNGKSHEEVVQHCEKVLGVTIRRPRKEKKPQPQSTYSGLGTTLKQLAATSALASLDYDDPVPIVTRSSASMFWGDIMPQYQHTPTDTASAIEALSSIVPLRLLVTAEKTEKEAAAVVQPVSQSTQAETSTTPAKTIHPWPPTAKDQLRFEANEIFTLSEMSRSNKGKKRKTDDINEDVDDNGLTVLVRPPSTMNGTTTGKTTAAGVAISTSTFSPQDPEPADAERNAEFESKRQAKKQKKAEKKARKEAEKVATEAKARATQPFDYASAPSLLTPDSLPLAQQGDSGGAAGGRGQGQMGAAREIMNPLAKALDTSKGVRRGKMGKELQGKSMTFNS
ncbi:uncharacterized protein Z519_10420 [Cladophialophora bantiana CBS 173.52]|uniref:HRDC domain-containing protein n=1 Tax=Cladophialophora bantiana (strain ATCC 10958 / CBS 173.52 / CDC B-1940 / NIH 8579) TaxID=1442370 RepID=A0A0D2EFW2_CLAB1|nr:uncharacterized protein Z519_10420 [Cladophialophora bantiana CBS 173.52]KIW88936.1 hypothetical protein Z519_10420 [Cladophialophora bantiana CBS 173.52]